MLYFSKLETFIVGNNLLFHNECDVAIVFNRVVEFDNVWMVYLVHEQDLVEHILLGKALRSLARHHF